MSVGTSTVEEYFKELKASRLETEFAGQCRQYGLPKPVEQFQFHNGRKWRFDFAWPEMLIAVECEGGIYVDGDAAKGHGGAAYERNCEKYNAATVNGWRVLRGGPNLVSSGALVACVAELMHKEGHIEMP